MAEEVHSKGKIQENPAAETFSTAESHHGDMWTEQSCSRQHKPLGGCPLQSWGMLQLAEPGGNRLFRPDVFWHRI